MKKLISGLLLSAILIGALFIPAYAYEFKAYEDEDGDILEYYCYNTATTHEYFTFEISDEMHWLNERCRSGKTMSITSFSDNFSRTLEVPDEMDGVQFKNVMLRDYSYIKTISLAPGIEAIACTIDEENINCVKTIYIGENFAVNGFDAVKVNKYSAFENLENVYLNIRNAKLDTRVNKKSSGILYTKGAKRLIFCPPKHEFWDKKLYNIPKKVERVEKYAFAHVEALEKVAFLGAGNVTICKNAFYNCKNLSVVKMRKKTKAPKIYKNAFAGTKEGIKFYVKNKKVAKQLKKQLRKKGVGVKKAKIYVGKKLVYKNVSSKK